MARDTRVTAMKANIPKSWFSLPKKEQEAIKNMLAEEFNKKLNEVINHEEAEMQKIWLKYACIALHEVFGFGENRCLSFLGTWRRIYKTNSKFKTDAEQNAWIDERIDKIFKGGYPSKFIDSFEGSRGDKP